MNVTTNYKTEAGFYASRSEQTDDELFRERAAERHDRNMAAWRELHAEHLAAGRIDIASNIMTMKIIPNIA